MAFEGYSRDIQPFFEALRANNNKAWFEANKQRFTDNVMAPSLALVETLIPELADLSPPLTGEAKLNGSIRRIYRDTRFSKDKTPYHSHLHMIFWVGHDKALNSAGVHFGLSDKGFGFGAGHWAFSPEQLAAYRADISADGGVKVKAAVATSVAGSGDSGARLTPPALKRVPRGFDADAEGANWLRHKGLVVRTGDGPFPEALYGPEGADLVLEICKSMAPINAYLAEHIF